MNRLKTFVALLLCVVAVASRVADAADAAEHQVTFQGTDGAELAGTLQLPARDGNMPAIVLLAGSGPTDRDGNQPPAIHTDLLKQIAQRLAEKGIASLRFDKRGMYANAAQLPKDRSQYGDFFSWENFVGDAVAACRFLQQQPRVDPDHVGILGHSEGGLLALQAASVLVRAGASACRPHSHQHTRTFIGGGAQRSVEATPGKAGRHAAADRLFSEGECPHLARSFKPGRFRKMCRRDWRRSILRIWENSCIASSRLTPANWPTHSQARC